MPNIIILGSGVWGLSIAKFLPQYYNITIVARDFPGDPENTDWASPWAGAGCGLGSTQDQKEQEMLTTSFRYFWELCEKHPESTVKRITEHRYLDNLDNDDHVWYKSWAPGYRVMSPDELPPKSRAKLATELTSMVMHADGYIRWLYAFLQGRGVRFVRKTVDSVAELASAEFGSPDVIVNASGNGAKYLKGVEDPLVEPIRGQTMLIRNTDIKKITIRTGDDYCYVIPRLDGTVIIGGIKEFGETTSDVKPELRADICKRAHEIEPLVPEDPAQLTIIRDIVGIRPGRKGGLRVEAETVEGLKIVHAYGGAGGGFAFSAGVAREVASLVDQHLYGREVSVTF